MGNAPFSTIANNVILSGVRRRRTKRNISTARCPRGKAKDARDRNEASMVMPPANPAARKAHYSAAPAVVSPISRDFRWRRMRR